MFKYFVIALLFSCGGPYQYKSDCLSNIDAYYEISQDVLDFNVELAKLSFDESGLADNTGFCRRFSNLHISVRSVTLWSCMGSPCYGWSDLTGIQIDVHGRSLVHELIHQYELQNGNLASGSHTGWREKGYYNITSDYEFSQRSLTGE